MARAKRTGYVEGASRQMRHRGQILISSLLGSAVFCQTAGVAHPVATPTPHSHTDLQLHKHGLPATVSWVHPDIVTPSPLADSPTGGEGEFNPRSQPPDENDKIEDMPPFQPGNEKIASFGADMPARTQPLSGITKKMRTFAHKLPAIQGETAATHSQQITAQQPPPAQPGKPATGAEDLRQQLLLPLPPVLQSPPLETVPAPGSSALSPTAFGASFGQAFAGAAFQGRTRFSNTSDGTISAGFGLGDARKSAGLQVSVTVLNLFNNREGRDDSAFNRGAISFKLHRLLSNDLAVAVGVENAIVWGFTDAGTSGYGVVSKIFRLKQNPAEPFSTLTLSLGLGGGRFRSEHDFQKGVDSINVFGSAAVRVTESVSAIADWAGQDLTLGVSIVPFRDIPLVITPAFTDITGSAGDGDRFFLGVGYSYSFSF